MNCLNCWAPIAYCCLACKIGRFELLFGVDDAISRLLREIGGKTTGVVGVGEGSESSKTKKNLGQQSIGISELILGIKELKLL